MVIDKGRLYTIDEILAKNGGPIPFSRSGAYNAIKNGQLPSVQIGRRWFIRGSVLLALVDVAQ